MKNKTSVIVQSRGSIQEYQPAHQPGIEEIYRNWFTGHFLTAPEPLDELFLKYPETVVLKKGGFILVTLEGEKVTGTVSLKKERGDGSEDTRPSYELTKMAVREGYRGKGLGAALCQAAIAKAWSAGAKRIVLYSHSSLQPALRLYRKLGFKDTPLEQGLYSHFRCDVKMEISLDPG
jgi:ribosomal protein S18 acetylase RimI-like enzyme